MKPITLLSYDYPPNDGGISRLSSAVASGLVSAGRRVEVVTVAASGGDGLVRPALPTTEVPRNRVARDWETFRMLLRLPHDALVLATIWSPEGALAWLALRKKFVLIAHGNEVMPYSAGIRNSLRRWLRRRVLSAARTVVCDSRYTEHLVLDACPDARTTVITPGVDSDRYHPSMDVNADRRRFALPGDCRLLLSVSRLNAYKGHDVVLKALAALPAQQRDAIHYVVAGKGEHLDTLRDLAGALGIAEHVTFLGFVSDADLPQLYGCADLFILCTREDPKERGVEGFGMVFLEAQASGVPVIGTRAGGIPDAIKEGEGGWLIAQDDVEGLCQHLKQLVQDPIVFRKQGEAARERVCQAGSWATYTDKLQTVLDDMC